MRCGERDGRVGLVRVCRGWVRAIGSGGRHCRRRGDLWARRVDARMGAGRCGGASGAGLGARLCRRLLCWGRPCVGGDVGHAGAARRVRAGAGSRTTLGTRRHSSRLTRVHPGGRVGGRPRRWLAWLGPHARHPRRLARSAPLGSRHPLHYMGQYASSLLLVGGIDLLLGADHARLTGLGQRLAEAARGVLRRWGPHARLRSAGVLLARCLVLLWAEAAISVTCGLLTVYLDVLVRVGITAQLLPVKARLGVDARSVLLASSWSCSARAPHSLRPTAQLHVLGALHAHISPFDSKRAAGD
jgi:hypothetical protein